ncbi:MAG: metal ABC transporter permease [Caldilineaceae bacterium SB0662_bin_9]|uniref:Metal ABC transporter permease n=1 Tax=Caldilineaceae bacterium SB0662_bin_9 TaxID=2605258 RepID=A0A6B1DRH8_9CHLR|nr:metal ABC transporter permease [Caldilineaceae bacterium SB0662_bin_9]
MGQPRLSSAKLDFVQLDVSVQLSADTTIGILFAGLFALSVALLPSVRHVRLNLEDLLLGQVLGASQVDVVVTAILTAVVAVVLYGLHSRLLFVSFDPLGAKVAELSATRLDSLFLILLAVATVTALQAVGIILVISLLITPAAAALLVARTFEHAMILSAGFGVSAAVVGLYVSHRLNVAARAMAVAAARRWELSRRYGAQPAAVPAGWTRGSRTVISVNSPGSDSTSMVPPWPRTMSLERARPRPVPSLVGFVVKKGLKIFSFTSSGMPVPLSCIRIATRSPSSQVDTFSVGM